MSSKRREYHVDCALTCVKFVIITTCTFDLSLLLGNTILVLVKLKLWESVII
jgi:hypothetical protein